jgi:23S rRNA (guanine745-N1)-methyltransferase
VLAPAGTVVVAAPGERHLAELVEPLGLLSVPGDKRERTEARLAPHLASASSRAVEFQLALSRADAAALVRMGPSAWHVDQESTAERLAAMPEPIAVTVSVSVSRYAAA